MIKYKLISILSILFFGCSSNNQTPNPDAITTISKSTKTKKEEQLKIDIDYFSRESSYNRVKDKINNNKPLVIHLRIPLCDNKNQGIVPVPEKLGNGFDLNNNLYWGAKYGFKNHFKQYTNWKLISSEKNWSNTILERVIFKKETANKTEVYIIADAYKGDAMKKCLEDFLNSVAGNEDEFILNNNEKLGIGSNADLLIFNGHNGLMDYDLELIPSKDQVIRETSVIGCISHKYFKKHLLASKGYPLLMTTNLMAPEAYVVESVIESWLNLDDETVVRKNVGIAYNKYQKCGIKGATKLFKYGW